MNECIYLFNTPTPSCCVAILPRREEKIRHVQVLPEGSCRSCGGTGHGEASPQGSQGEEISWGTPYRVLLQGHSCQWNCSVKEITDFSDKTMSRWEFCLSDFLRWTVIYFWTMSVDFNGDKVCWEWPQAFFREFGMLISGRSSIWLNLTFSDHLLFIVLWWELRLKTLLD